MFFVVVNGVVCVCVCVCVCVQGENDIWGSVMTFLLDCLVL